MNILPTDIYSLTTIKQNDTARTLYDELTIGGTAVDLSGSSVLLVWHDPVSKVTTRKSASISVPSSGSIYYDLTSDDVATAGSFLCEWELHMSNGKELTFPSEGYMKLNIEDDLDI